MQDRHFGDTFTKDDFTIEPLHSGIYKRILSTEDTASPGLMYRRCHGRILRKILPIKFGSFTNEDAFTVQKLQKIACKRKAL